MPHKFSGTGLISNRANLRHEHKSQVSRASLHNLSLQKMKSDCSMGSDGNTSQFDNLIM